ncbi:MAG: hypothetical protein GF344_00805 [Chitinivibrionales bacterium]|nr:hypothetical protein [Chitinivibrionales bacterium]
MKRDRLESVGIKQVVRLEWYDYALDMVLNGISKDETRLKLDAYISEREQSGGYGERGAQTYTKAVTQIMKCWVTPESDLRTFRDRALELARHTERQSRLVLHWAVTTATYPFWQRVAELAGRMLNLQESITQSQIRQRCYELFGERSTVERSARRVIRSFVAWKVLKDSKVKGCYRRSAPIPVAEPKALALLVEAALRALPGGKMEIRRLQNHPAFFSFTIPPVSGSIIESANSCITVERYGLDDELLRISTAKSCSI